MLKLEQGIIDNKEEMCQENFGFHTDVKIKIEEFSKEQLKEALTRDNIRMANKVEQDIANIKEEMCGEYFEFCSEDKMETKEFNEKRCSICSMTVRNMHVHMKLNHKKKKQREIKSFSSTGTPSPPTKRKSSNLLIPNQERITMIAQCPVKA